MFKFVIKYQFLILKRPNRIESSIPFARNPNLIGNLDQNELESKLLQSKLVVIYGPPGIGKTSHALEIAYKKCKHKNGLWRSVWFSAETKEKFTVDLKAFYQVLRPNESNDEKPTFGNMILFIKNELKTEKEKKTNFLFILDNFIENKEDKWIENFLALMPENVFILITSRNQNVLSISKTSKKKAKSLEVKYFTKEQGEEFFKAKINKDRNLSKNETDLLEEYFNGGQVLPYDLNLLVNVLNENELLKIETFLAGNKELCETIFDELRKIISKQSKESWSTLECCSFIDPDAIPVFLAMKFVEINDEMNFQTKVLNILKRNGVVEVFKQKTTETWCIKIHRRTQEMIQRIVSENKENLEIIKKNIEKIIFNEMPEIDENPDEKWTKANIIFPHAIKIISFLEERSYLSDLIGKYFWLCLLDYKKAIEYFQDSIQNFPDECHPSLASTYFNIGNVYQEMGDFPSALNYKLDAKRLFETIYPDKCHPSLATVYGSIGNIYLQMKDFTSVLKYQLDAMKIQETIYPDKCHSSLAITYLDIATVYQEMEDFPSALKYHLDSKKIFETIYQDKCHPSLADTYGNIGNIYKEMRDFPSALKYLLDAMRIQETIYPDKCHPFLAITYENIGFVYKQMGDFTSALKYELDALRIREANHSDKLHPSLASSYGKIGNIYTEMEDFPSALKYLLDAMRIQETIYPDKCHPSLADTYGNIGNVFFQMADFPSALKFQLTSMRILKTIYSDKYHPSLVSTYVNIGNVYNVIGDFPSALKYQLDAIKIYETIYPDKCHPDLASAYGNIRILYLHMGYYSLALKYHFDAMRIKKTIYLYKIHPSLANMYGNIFLFSLFLLLCLCLYTLLLPSLIFILIIIVYYGWRLPKKLIRRYFDISKNLSKVWRIRKNFRSHRTKAKFNK